MSIEAHLQTVAQKRTQLKQQIAEEMAHASPNFVLIKQLKRQNLALKEETQRMLILLKEKTAAAS